MTNNATIDLLKKKKLTKEEVEILRKEANRLHDLGVIYLMRIDLDEQEWRQKYGH